MNVLFAKNLNRKNVIFMCKSCCTINSTIGGYVVKKFFFCIFLYRKSKQKIVQEKDFFSEKNSFFGLEEAI